MSRIYGSIEETIGNTPLVELSRLKREHKLAGSIYAKLEGFNPAGSAKDRIAFNIIKEYEREGRLAPGGIIIEPTSGNTGVGLALISVVKGYKLIVVMPDTMSIERRRLIAAYGAQLVLTDGKLGMRGAINRANELHEEIPGSVLAGQFINPANPAIHYETTGPEILRDTDGKVDVFVAGVGTGGTVSGAGKFLKEQLAHLKVVAVEPVDSPVLSGGSPAPHKIQGIGAGFVPDTYNASVVDEISTVAYPDAVSAARDLATHEGILVGISSGAALHTALEIAARPDMEGKHIVVMLPDTGERYLSTELFSE